MSNRETYPSSLFPLRGDLSAEAGATTVSVIGEHFAPNTQSGNYVLLASDTFVIFTATATATLPTSATSAGKTYIIKLVGTGLAVTVVSESGTIDGSANAIITTNNSSFNFTWDGVSNWDIN